MPEQSSGREPKGVHLELHLALSLLCPLLLLTFLMSAHLSIILPLSVLLPGCSSLLWICIREEQRCQLLIVSKRKAD